MRLRDRTSQLSATLLLHDPHRRCSSVLLHFHGLHGLRTPDLFLQQNFPQDKFSFAKILSICSKEKTLEKGKCMHALSVALGFDSDPIVATTVLSLYGKCGILDDAHNIFDGLRDKDVISWNAIMSAYAKHGHEACCVCFYDDMHQKSILADKFTFVSMLSACASLQDIKTGQHIHARLAILGYRFEVILDTALIHMYSRCKNMDHARSVFDGVEHHDVISWNTIISGYAQSEHAEDAFHLFHEMLGKGVAPNIVTFIVILDACAALPDGQLIHAWLIEAGFEVDVIPGSALVNMYCTFSHLNDAHKVFNSLLERNLITWNSLIAGYAAQNCLEEALELFRTMQDRGINPDRITWSTAIDACAGLNSLAKGESMYNFVVIIGLEYDNSIVASAIKLYANFGCIDTSNMLFRRVSQKNFLLWNSLMMVNSQHGLLSEACELLYHMQESGVVPDCQVFVDLLGTCAKHAAFVEGRYLHSAATFLAINTDSLVTTALIHMYGNCNSLEDAWYLFEQTTERNGALWTSIVEAYALSGNAAHATHLYLEMCRDNVLLDKVMFLRLLKACSMQDFPTDGQNMHTEITTRGFDLDIMVANALTDMYGKCGALSDAKRVFDSIRYRDVVSWNTIITANAQQNNLTEIYSLVCQMEKEGISPDEVTYVSMLSAHTWTNRPAELTLVHSCIVHGHFEAAPAVISSLIHYYGKLGKLEDARCLCDKLLIRNTVTWNAMITGHTEKGRTAEAVQFFVQMQTEGVLTEKASYVCTLNAFNGLSGLLCGKHLHACILSLGFSPDILVTTALISFYGRCCSLEDACTLFYGMPDKDEVSWSAFMRALSNNGSLPQALQLFEQMLQEAVIPNLTVFLNILHACTKHGAVIDGLRMHTRLLCSTYLSNSEVRNAVLNMYGEFGSTINMERNFFEMQEHDAISFNIMIKSYSHAHHPQEALQTFLQMGVEGIFPDIITLASVLEVCGSLGAFFQGKVVHTCLIYGSLSHVVVNNAAVNMYFKCRHLQEALEAFNRNVKRDVTSWNAMISAFCSHGHEKKAIEIFITMLSEISPDVITFATILCACRNEETLRYGRLVHYLITSLGFEQEVMVGNSLISMYGRCGRSNEAERIFERLLGKNVATWNAMLTSDMLGAGNLYSVEDMQRQGLSPNEITFVGILDFCGSNGAFSRGRMLHIHFVLCGFELDVNIVSSLVNFYGKCGMLKDAVSLFKDAVGKNKFTWTAMIAAYSSYGLGEEALHLIMEMNHKSLMVDKVTLISFLSACCHSGSLDCGQHFLSDIVWSDMAEIQHLSCVIDLLGRLGQLTEAETMIWSMPFQPTPIIWTALLGACQTVGDIDRASRAVSQIVELTAQILAEC